MSLKQYRGMDLAIFAVILLASQLVITFASTRWFADQLYVVSPVAAIVAIVMMRWNGWSVLHAALGGAAFCFFSGGSCKHLLIYGLGNLLALAAMVMLKRMGKQRVRDDVTLSLCFAALVQALMLLGRMAVSLAVSGLDWSSSLGFVTTDVLSMVFTLVLVWIARRADGLFEDQLHYLRRVQKEDQTEGGERT